MSGETIAQKLATIKNRLALYIKAEADILACGQSYSISDRSLTRADLRWIRREISTLQNQCDRLENGGGITTKFAVPRDT